VAEIQASYEKGEKKVDKYNFGTMSRKSVETGYVSEETILAVKDAVLLGRDCKGMWRVWTIGSMSGRGGRCRRRTT
jgi:hypothetical protein